MTKEEWVELFQAMNGRDPLPQEFLEAKNKGEFSTTPSLTQNQDSEEVSTSVHPLGVSQIDNSELSLKELEESELSSDGVEADNYSEQRISSPDDKGDTLVDTSVELGDHVNDDLIAVTPTNEWSSHGENFREETSSGFNPGQSPTSETLSQLNEKANVYASLAADKVKSGSKIAFNQFKKGANSAVTTFKEKQEEQRILKAQFQDTGSYFDGGILEYIIYSIGISFLTGLTLGLALPWAVCIWYDWETRHTVIEGRRLQFSGTGMQLLGNWIKWFFLIIITFGIYGFWVRVKIKQWVVKHTHFVD